MAVQEENVASRVLFMNERTGERHQPTTLDDTPDGIIGTPGQADGWRVHPGLVEEEQGPLRIGKVLDQAVGVIEGLARTGIRDPERTSADKIAELIPGE